MLVELKEPTPEEIDLCYEMMEKENRTRMVYLNGDLTSEVFRYQAELNTPWLADTFYVVLVDNIVSGFVLLNVNDLHFCTFSAMNETKVEVGKEVVRQLFERNPSFKIMTGVTPTKRRDVVRYCLAIGAEQLPVLKDYFDSNYGSTARDGSFLVFHRKDFIKEK